MTLGRRCFAFAVIPALFTTTTAQAAVFALRAVQINDVPITAASSVNVCPGDTIVTEIHLSDWSGGGERLKIWQAELDAQRFASGTTGLVLPLGWDAGLDTPDCAVDGDCADGLQCTVASCTAGFCVGPDHEPEAGAFIDTSRPDYVFTGTVSLPARDLCGGGTPGYRFGALVFSGAMPMYVAPPKYAGTLILVVAKDASGTFEIGFSSGEGTFLKDENGVSIFPRELQNLTVDVSAGGGVPCRLAESDPPNCAIDPRQPSDPGGVEPTGWDRISLSFDSDASGLTVDATGNDPTPDNDNWSRGDGLATVIPAGISLGLQGIGHFHSDIGGFTTVAWIRRSKELFLRWTEMAAFSLQMRSHEGNRPERNWQFDSDQETLALLARMTEVFNRLKGYRLHCLEEYRRSGLPVIRHPYLHYEQDSALHKLKYQYLLGRDLMVAPVISPRRKRWGVYLPEDRWIHLWSGKEYPPGRHRIPAPLGQPPVFYRSESAFQETFEAIRREVHQE